MVNILNGELGDVYGDLNQDDVQENPGDGFGVLPYLAALDEKLVTLRKSLVISTSAGSSVSDPVQLAFAMISTKVNWMEKRRWSFF